MSTSKGTVHEFMAFPNEQQAVLATPDGQVEVRFGYTFLHDINGLLAGLDVVGRPYQRDFNELRYVLNAIEQVLLADHSRSITDDEEQLLLERYHEKGRGYWSTWMEEDCPWAGDQPVTAIAKAEGKEEPKP